MSDQNYALSLSRFSKWGLAAIFALVLAGSISTAHADPTYTLAPVTFVQTGGPFVTSIGGGLNQWVTPLQVTNTSANPIYSVSWVSFTAEVSEDGSNFYFGTWDNTSQQWEVTTPISATVAVGNAAFYLSQSQTDVTFPAGDGSDSFPLISVAGVILPGDSASFDVVDDLSSNVNVFFFTGDVLDATPEPGALSLMLLGCCAGGCFAYFRRRKFAANTLPGF
jgi:hypothetical protein